MATKPPAQARRSRKPVRMRRPNASYLALVKAFPIRPIRSEEEVDEAIAVLDGLLERSKPLDSQEQDYLDCLSNEIERYETEAFPMPHVSESAMLAHLMEAKGVSLSEVAEATGIALSSLSSIRSGKRRLNRTHIEKLASYFFVEPGVFFDSE
jgi:HTH-type transcriptional regulator / antitoxin HigA